MQVELLQAILEGRSVKTVLKDGKEPVVFVKGAIITMSETSAAKYIEKGWAKAVEAAVEATDKTE